MRTGLEDDLDAVRSAAKDARPVSLAGARHAPDGHLGGYPVGMLRVATPWLLLALALAVAGLVLYVVADGLLETLSLGVIGIAAVVGVSALFYAVGVSEDRDRARERSRDPGR